VVDICLEVSSAWGRSRSSTSRAEDLYMDHHEMGNPEIDGPGLMTYKYKRYVRHSGDAVNTKLTLRMDARLIRRAKAYSKQRGKSLSKLVADYFAALIAVEEEREAEDTPPITAALSGLLEGSGVDELDYYDYLEKKYR
jgi:hypothetical protein